MPSWVIGLKSGGDSMGFNSGAFMRGGDIVCSSGSDGEYMLMGEGPSGKIPTLRRQQDYSHVKVTPYLIPPWRLATSRTKKDVTCIENVC
jgi:hypothetical protein